VKTQGTRYKLAFFALGWLIAVGIVFQIALGQGFASGPRPENEDQRWPVAAFESREVPSGKPPHERISDSTHRAISWAAFTFARAVASS